MSHMKRIHSFAMQLIREKNSENLNIANINTSTIFRFSAKQILKVLTACVLTVKSHPILYVSVVKCFKLTLLKICHSKLNGIKLKHI